MEVTKRMLLEQLRDRLREAAGPDRELDGRLLCAVYSHDFMMWDGAGTVIGRPGGISGIGRIPSRDIRPFTASLDAAATLVPDGWRLRNMQQANPETKYLPATAELIPTSLTDNDAWAICGGTSLYASHLTSLVHAILLARVEYEIRKAGP